MSLNFNFDDFGCLSSLEHMEGQQNASALYDKKCALLGIAFTAIAPRAKVLENWFAD